MKEFLGLGGYKSSIGSLFGEKADYLIRPDLSSLSLRDRNLNKADFKGANLRNSDLSGSTLKRADLRDADLVGATLLHTDTTGANMDGAIIDDGDGNEYVLMDSKWRKMYKVRVLDKTYIVPDRKLPVLKSLGSQIYLTDRGFY